MTRCSAEPISYLQLERYVLGELPAEAGAEIRAHLQQCEACRGCLAELGPVQLPPLPLPPRRRSRLLRPLSYGAVIAAAAAALLLLRAPSPAPFPASRVSVKGGELALELIREPLGGVARGAEVFEDGDRFELRLTCPFEAPQHWTVRVYQDGQTFVPLRSQRPLACGNRVPLGALRLTGHAAARVCVTTSELPETAACVQVRPSGVSAGDQKK